MYQYASTDIGELAHQLTISPARLRISQLEGIEKLTGIVKPEGSYPYELVCFHITGYQSRGKEPRPSIAGRKLVPDLVTMAEHISRKANIPVESLTEKYVLQEDLGKRLNVSIKTVRRWRGRGLMGLRVVFADGANRQVFWERTIERFCRQNVSLVERGAAFKQLSAAEKKAIVSRARELLSVRRIKLHLVARQVASEMNRAVETVRYTLRRWDQSHPDEALFSNGGLPLVSERHLAIWQSSQAGDPADKIAAAFDCDVEAVQQILREMEIRRLKEQRIRYVYCDEFAAPDADRAILGPEPVVEEQSGRTSRPPKDLPPYLRSLYEIPLLTREQERDLFRRFNYLKYRAVTLLESVSDCEVTAEEFDTVRRLLSASEEIKKRIIQANLRLVVSIAKRHVNGKAANFFEVVSDGNLSLMRAVENFDYSRGNKFSTYGSWAIIKNYARTIPENHYRYARYVTGQDELLDAAADHRAAPVSAERTEGLRETLATGLVALTERERTIITEHFGLFGRSASRTLEDLGRHFGVTKERIRQIERRALCKLQGVLSPDALDLLAD